MKTLDEILGEQNVKPFKAKRNKLSPDAKNVKILTIDIETSPNLAYVWGLWDQNVSLTQLMEKGHVICFVAKWYDSKEVIFKSDYHDGHKEMIQAAHDLLSEADIVVGYNSIGFDMKHLHREFLLAGLQPPTPYKNIDLMLIVKKQFKFVSNKLDNVVQELGLGAKTHHTGFQMWLDCMLGDDAKKAKAWALMKRYNIQDVKITEALYDALRGWIPNHPHMGMFTGDEWCCPNCGHKDVSKNREGIAHTNVQRYRQYRCPKCGTPIRGNKKMIDPTSTRISRNG